MLGIKSIAITLLTASTVVVTVRSGVLDAEHLRHLSTNGAFLVGLFATLSAALVAFGARPGRPSKVALVLGRGRPSFVFDVDRARVREVPAVIQHLCFVATFGCIGLAALGGNAVAHLAALPDGLTEPSGAVYCLPEKPVPEKKAAAPAPPPPPPVDQAGCALVKRAFALGYTKSLGDCAPKTQIAASAPTPTETKAIEICERRQLDEPFAHYAYRKVSESVAGASPVDSATDAFDQVRTRFSFTRDLVADIGHSITGTPHASHHLFINLPDPHPTSLVARAFTGEESCTNRFAELPLWPAYTSSTPPAIVLEHAFGQLLFATRFGTPASCSDYTIHWDAPRDACAQIAKDPEAILDERDALDPIREVLDRRRRQVALRSLAGALGREPTLPEPPPVRAVTSVSCLMIDPAGSLRASGQEITVDSETLSMREVTMTTLSPVGAGPLDAYIALALLLGGTKHGGPAIDDASRMFEIEPDFDADTDLGSASADTDPGSASGAGSGSASGSASGSGPPTAPATAPGPGRRAVPAELPGPFTDGTFMLVELEPLVDSDPFARTGPAAPALNAALARPDLVEVYPFARHLHDFIDRFRRIYLPQRGRL